MRKHPLNSLQILIYLVICSYDNVRPFPLQLSLIHLIFSQIDTNQIITKCDVATHFSVYN